MKPKNFWTFLWMVLFLSACIQGEKKDALDKSYEALEMRSSGSLVEWQPEGWRYQNGLSTWEDISQGDQEVMALRKAQALVDTSKELNPKQLHYFAYISSEIKQSHTKEKRLLFWMNKIDEGLLSLGPHQVIKTREDASRMIGQLKGFTRYLEQLKPGISQSLNTASQMEKEVFIDRLDQLINLSARENPIYYNFAFWAYRASPVDLNQLEAVDFLETILMVWERDIVPKFRSIIGALEKVDVKESPPEYSYEKALESLTHRSWDMKSLEQNILDWEALYRTRLTRLLKNEGYPGNTLTDQLRKLSLDPLFNQNDSLVRVQMKEWEAQISPLIIGIFEDVPYQDLRIRKQLASPRTGSAYQYVHTGLNSERPAVLYLDSAKVSQWKSWQMRTLSYASIVPGGHFYQNQLICNDSLSYLERSYSMPGTLEGWGLYAAHLAHKDLGLYGGNPMDEIGFYYFMLEELLNLKCDKGIHLENWSIENARTFLMTGLGISEEVAREKIRQIRLHPGHESLSFLAYLELLSRRKAFFRKKGSATLVDFHKSLLNGAASIW